MRSELDVCCMRSGLAGRCVSSALHRRTHERRCGTVIRDKRGLRRAGRWVTIAPLHAGATQWVKHRIRHAKTESSTLLTRLIFWPSLRTARHAAAGNSLLGALLCAWPGAPTRAEPAVTFYGIIDAGIGYFSNGDGESRVDVRSGQASSSRLGLRGSEPLGDKLKLEFKLEADVEADASMDGLAWNRQSWIGLKGSFGTITAGRQYRPEARVVLQMDPYHGSSVASPPNTYSNLVYRTSNALVYETPRIAGWQGLAMVVPGEQSNRPGAVRDDRGFGLTYRRGPLQLGYGWDRRVNAKATDSRVWQSIGGTYDLDAAKIYAAYRSRKENAAELDERSYWIGASAPLGAFTLRGVVGAVDDRSADRQGTTALGLGIEYRLSKRTDLYARYAKLRNRNGAGFDLGDNIQGSAPQALALGLRLRF